MEGSERHETDCQCVCWRDRGCSGSVDKVPEGIREVRQTRALEIGAVGGGLTRKCDDVEALASVL